MTLVRNDILRRLESAETSHGATPEPVRVVFKEFEGQTDDELRVKNGWPPETPLLIFRVVDARKTTERIESMSNP